MWEKIAIDLIDFLRFFAIYCDLLWFRVGPNRISSQLPVSDLSEWRHLYMWKETYIWEKRPTNVKRDLHMRQEASRLRFEWETSHLSLFLVTKNATRHICHISGKNVTLSHTKIFFLTCDVFCHILPKKRHILAPLVQNFFEREETWRFIWDWNMFSSSRLRFVNYLGSVKREGHLG